MIKKRLNKGEIEHIKKLIKSGSSLNNISHLMGKSKTTIYYYFRKIRGRTIKPLCINYNDGLIGEFIGLFAGDGCVYKTKDCNYRTYLCFNLREKEFVNELINNVLINIFNKKPLIFIQGNRLNLCYISKQIHLLVYQYLEWDKKSRKTYSVRLKNKNHSRDFIIGFIRGSLDSDGHFSRNKISFATVSPGLKNNLSYFLNCLNIRHSVNLYQEKRENRKDIYHINVLKRDYNIFVNLIKPRNIKK
jgi:hypothetical protein